MDERPRQCRLCMEAGRSISEAKQTLAREVPRHVPNGVSLAFSIGTTPVIVSKALLGHQHLRIFTNNLNIAMLEQSGAQLIVCKGDLSP